MPRHAVEKRLILPFGGIDVAGFAQLVADRVSNKRVVGIGFSSAPKPGKRAGAVAALADGKREPDKGAAVAGLGGDYLAVLRFRFIKASELPQLVRRRQPGKPVLRIQRRSTAEELQRDRSLAPLAGAKSEPEQCAPVRRRVFQYRAIEPLGGIELAGFAQPVGLSQLFVGRSVRRSAP